MTDTRNSRGAVGAFIVVTSLFFAWGFITSLIDPLIAAVKGIYELSDREALLTQFAFFISYFVISLPAAALLTTVGYVRTILISVAAMFAACLIILLATFAEAYGAVLFGLFVMGSGITALQVAANPLSAALGEKGRSHFRLLFSQAFNSLGTVIGPYLGARVMLQGTVHEGGVVDAAARTEALGHIHTAFLIIAVPDDLARSCSSGFRAPDRAPHRRRRWRHRRSAPSRRAGRWSAASPSSSTSAPRCRSAACSPCSSPSRASSTCRSSRRRSWSPSTGAAPWSAASSATGC